MKYKILTDTQGYLFLELPDEICKLMKNYQNTPYDLEFELFLQIPNLTKVDILEYFEESILDLATGYSGNGIELDSLFFEFLFDSTNVTAGNSANPTYISEYINIVGQLFLAGYIDFGLCGLQDKEENLLSRQRDKYQAWIHFRDNFFYTDAFYRDYEILDDSEDFSTEEYGKAGWDMPKYWDRYRFWVARTPKGDEYFEKVLAPRFYEKYKDLEVEIDSKGNIVRWLGQINR